MRAGEAPRRINSKARLVIGALAVLLITSSYAGSQQAPQGQNEETADHPQKAQTQKRGTELEPFVIKILQPTITEERAAQDKKDRDEKRISDNKLTDFTGRLADYTLYLVIIGIIQAFIFFFQLYTIFRQEKWTKTHERAYIYGGIGPANHGLVNGVHTAMGNITMANYGRTPGFITEIRVGTCRIVDLPESPTYEENFVTISVVSDLWATGTDPVIGLRATAAHWECPIDGAHVIFQRVFYEDVFRRRHYSGSIYRFFTPPGGGFGSEPYVANQAYWERD